MNIFIIVIFNDNNKKYIDIIYRSIMNDDTSIMNDDTSVMNDDTSVMDENYIFFTHQYRLKHSLIGTLNELGFEIPKKKFSNNAIICLILSPNPREEDDDDNLNINLRMIHSGDVETNKEGEDYWVGGENMTNNMSINKEDFCKVFKINMDSFNINSTINCYFIRHGEAEHNTNKNFLTRHLKDNTKLTITNDSEQAMKDAGIALNYALQNGSINAIFVSDLIRTQQTAGYILSEVNSFNNKVPIFVLPCLHESTSGDGKGIFNIFARENQTDCRSREGVFQKQCSIITLTNDRNVPINWSLYKLFYGGYYRDYIRNVSRYQCRNNHFLGLFFNNKGKIDSDNISTINVYNNASNESNINNIYEQLNDEGYQNDDDDNDDAPRIIPNQGGKKRRQTKKHRAMKSKKVRRVKKSNKKSKKVKRRSNKRKA